LNFWGYFGISGFNDDVLTGMDIGCDLNTNSVGAVFCLCGMVGYQ
jgi:hypothetical protein